MSDEPKLTWSLPAEEREAVEYTMKAIVSMRVEGEPFDQQMKRELAFIGGVRQKVTPPDKP